MGGIGAGTHVCNSSSVTKGVESTFKFSTVVGTHTQGGPKNLKDFLMDSFGYSRTGFVRYGSDDNKLAKATDSN